MRFPSREDHALEFVRVCVSVPAGSRGPSQGLPDVQPTRAQAALTLLRLAGYTVFLGVVCPVLFFACLLPLELDGVPYELWMIYYYSIMGLVFLGFSFHLVWLALDQGPSSVAAAVFYTLVFLADVVLVSVAPCNDVRTSRSVGGQFACLFFPSVHVALWCIIEGRPVRHAVMHIIGLMTGAIPPFLAAAYYYLLHHVGWKDDMPVLALAMLFWSLTPLVLKSLGNWIWLRAAPAVPGMISVLWIFNCEVAFSCFGFMVFMHTPASAILYALMLVPVLLIQVFRGTNWAFQCSRCMNTLTLHRVMLHLASFAMVMGRIAAYTLYMSFSLLKLCSPDRDSIVARVRIFTAESFPMAASINIYSQQDVSWNILWTGALGMALVVSVFVVFNLAVPEVWKVPASKQSAAAARPEALGRPAEDSAGKEGEGASMQCGSQAPGSERHCTPSVAWVEEESMRSGWLRGRSGGLLFLQQRLVLKFTADFLKIMVVTLIFNFALSLLMINLALAWIHKEGGAFCT